MSNKLDLTILQGKTFTQVVRWETDPIVYKPISAVTNTAPVSISAAGHGLPNGWRVTVVSVKGMTQLNAAHTPPKDADYAPATVVDPNTITLNTVNAASYKTYTSGGYLQYNTPHDLTGYTARMTVKNRVGGTVLETLTNANGKIVLDTTAYTVKLLLSAVVTAAYTYTSGVYDLELISPAGDVTLVLYGKIKVTKEVTT